MYKELFHSPRGQHLCNFNGTKELAFTFYEQESPKSDFNWAAEGDFPGGGVLYTLRSPHNLVAKPLCDIASHVRVKHKLISTLYPFGTLL